MLRRKPGDRPPRAIKYLSAIRHRNGTRCTSDGMGYLVPIILSKNFLLKLAEMNVDYDYAKIGLD